MCGIYGITERNPEYINSYIRQCSHRGPDGSSIWYDDDISLAKDLTRRIVERALELEGTCTGEHGVGIGKIEFMEKEHGEAYQVMSSIKRTFDPNGILNPGKVVKIN